MSNSDKITDYPEVCKQILSDRCFSQLKKHADGLEAIAGKKAADFIYVLAALVAFDIAAEPERINAYADKRTDTLGTLVSENCLVKLDGKNFRCVCGANVFQSYRKGEKSIYKCNGCGTTYTGT
jgi:hypothetical protein